MAVNEIKIWDPLVRIGHWSLVAGFAVAYLTEDDFLTLHVWAGYLVGFVVLFRILWGFVGSEHARFRDFLYSPKVVLGYLRDLGRFRSRRYLGHSPAGGAMIIALLIGLTATVATGLMAYGADRKAGPLASLYAGASTPLVAEKDGKDSEIQEIHELLANLTLGLVLFHVGGVVLAGLVHKENLARAMVTGRKRAETPGTKT